MPRLYGIRYYRFVAPGWTHPLGWQTDRIPNARLYNDEYARAQAQLVEALTLDSAQCAQVGHSLSARRRRPDDYNARHNLNGFPYAVDCGSLRPPMVCDWDSVLEGRLLPFCVARLEHAQRLLPSAERTELVRVHIPADPDPPIEIPTAKARFRPPTK